MPADQKSPAYVSETIAAITRWLTSRARLITDTKARNEAIVERLRAAGLPIVRFTIGMPTLHPQLDGFSMQWEEGKDMFFREHRRSETDEDDLRRSPIFRAFEEGIRSRHRLLEPPGANEASILDDLRSGGFTDYVVLALPFGDGSNKGMTFATNAPDGFSDDQIEILYGLAPAFAATIEPRYLSHLAGMLMDTYVGPVAGRKVLAGDIKRGSGETIRAVVWFCDLKGFTALSERLSGAALLEMLNAYFEAITLAIEAENGEVLKFIGDAILAIFQPGEDDKNDKASGAGDRQAAVRALTAARAALRELAVVNEVRRAHRQTAIECGIVLHFGDVLYGNVGGRRRLDFTVIGPAVNLASRIESLTGELARPLLVSEVFATVHGGAFENLGAFAFKGIAEEKTVFAPRE